MAPPKQNAAQKSAQQFFSKAEEGDKARKNANKKERDSVAINTAKLRELRLAKEAADLEAAAKQALENPTSAKAKAASKKPPARKTVRMFY